MIAAIKTGRVDWVTDSLFPALIFADKTGAEIFLRRWEEEIEKDHTVFVTLKTSDVNSLDDLERKIIIFKDARSTSSYFIPYYELLDEDYVLALYGKGDAKKIGGKKRLYYRFAEKEYDVLQEVLKSGWNIGVFNNVEYDVLSSEIKGELKVIHRTASYPRAVELVRNDLDVDIKNKLKNILLESEKQTKTSTILSESGSRRFDEFVAEGRDSYVYLKNLVRHGVVPVIDEEK
jgi:phosphonate transport system substrate-binding protein